MDKSDKKEERRFSQEQYEMLKRCSEKKDIREWNKWVEDNPKEEIWGHHTYFSGEHVWAGGELKVSG